MEETTSSLGLYLQFCILCLILLYKIIKWWKYYGVPENFPPGPPCVPFLGTLPFIKVILVRLFCQEIIRILLTASTNKVISRLW